jgi:hypothetical protein
MKRTRRIALAMLAFVTVFVSACGGGGPVPSDLVGARLDVAEHELDQMGIGYDEIGGGFAGILVKANWVVCQTKPTAGQPVNGNVQLIVARSC